MMMIDPVDSDDDEAQDVGKKGRPHLRQGSWCRIVRGLQLQNHDGNENGDNAIADRFDPVRFHAPKCNMGELARKLAASEIDESIDSNCYRMLPRRKRFEPDWQNGWAIFIICDNLDARRA